MPRPKQARPRRLVRTARQRRARERAQLREAARASLGVHGDLANLAMGGARGEGLGELRRRVRDLVELLDELGELAERGAEGDASP